MTKVVLEIDERTLDRVADAARARSVTIESVIAERIAEMASLAPIVIENPSHRAMLAILESSSQASGGREGLHDREWARAEAYADNRRRLLALVDASDGDLGDRAFDRASLYDR